MPALDYEASVEEALCYGWIDSIIRKLDDARYCRKFTPRKDGSNWSASNRERVARLIAAGRMTEHGMAKVEAAKASGMWEADTRPPTKLDVPPELEAALVRNRKARETFDALAPSYRKQYVGWIATAKREATREKRVKEAVRLLARGEKLGMK